MSTPIDLTALKNRQMASWASGDYAIIGTTLQIVGEQLAEACDLLCDERVLDVAAGNGNATLAAARRGCHVTSTDYVAALLERGEDRARAERLEVTFQVADAEALHRAQPKATLTLLPGINHVLRPVASDDRAANLATYRDAALAISPSVAEAVAGFVRR